jgi:nucleoside-diphosphate kinase
MERTLMLIKPDAVQRCLIGEIIRRIEQKGLEIVAMKLMQMTSELARKHYAEHVEKPFFPDLEHYITSGPIVAMVIEGDYVIESIRKLNGATGPIEAAPGTIRADLGVHKTMNLVHGSDSVESAEREIRIFFTESEIIPYDRSINRWI